MAAGWFDYDRDGRLDLFVVNYAKWTPALARFCGNSVRRIRVYRHPKYFGGLPRPPYSDVVFGSFRLLGYRFSPRPADIGGTRFWRIDPKADYGKLNAISQHRLSLRRITPHWDDMLRLAGSLKLGRVPATGIMRTLQAGDHSTRLAQAIAEFGRFEKTLHVLNMIDDENKP